MSYSDPKYPFDGYDPSGVYPSMMALIIAWETYQANEMGRWLLQKLRPRTIIDIGCGTGTYLIPFKEAGCKVFGVDACQTGGELLDSDEFQRVDLRFPFTPVSKFDLALCIEVAEHLERRWSELLVDTLSLCSDTIVFTAATPNQGGIDHVNEQPHEFWLEIFKNRHGYVIHSLHEMLRTFLNGLPHDLCPAWLRNNIFLLERKPKC